jgi:hypothetical protein
MYEGNICSSAQFSSHQSTDNYIHKPSSYLTGNTLDLRNKSHSVNAVMKMAAASSEIRTKPIQTLTKRRSGLNMKANGTYRHRCFIYIF